MFRLGFPSHWSTLKKLVYLRAVTASPYATLTATGVSPLSLPNAVAKAIVSLIQTGKCVTSDGVTSCNNGKLVAVDDELPSGYKRLASIQFDGATHYDTGEKLTGEDIVTLELSVTIQSGQNVFGCYAGTSEGAKNFSLYLYGAGSTSNSYFRFGEQLLRPRYGSGRKEITFGKGGTSGFTTDATAEPETFTTNTNAWIGTLPNSTSPAYTGNIWGSIKVGTRLEWIPCERTADGTVCYYEKYTKTVLEPLGGTPTAGEYDISHENTLAVVGTPEVLTVSGTDHTQTASVVNLFSSGDAADTQDIITGSVTRRVSVVVSAGTITLSPLAEPVTEAVAAQPLSTVEGTNTVTVTAEVDDIPLTVTYKGTE